MPNLRFNNLEPDKRERILEVAGQEFADHGYDGASLSHILEHVGISKGAAYYYFDSKADLFATVVEHHVDKILGGQGDDMLSLFQGTDRNTFWPTWRRLGERVFQGEYEAHRTLGLLRMAWQQSKEARDVDLTGRFERAYQFSRSFIAKGRELGAIRTDVPEDLLLHAYAALDEAFDRWVEQHRDDMTHQEIREVAMRARYLFQSLLEPPRGAER